MLTCEGEWGRGEPISTHEQRTWTSRNQTFASGQLTSRTVIRFWSWSAHPLLARNLALIRLCNRKWQKTRATF